MSEIRLIECAIISLCSDVFILINFYPHCDKNIFSGVCSYLEYRVVPRETVLFDYWLIHIRVQQSWFKKIHEIIGKTPVTGLQISIENDISI